MEQTVKVIHIEEVLVVSVPGSDIRNMIARLELPTIEAQEGDQHICASLSLVSKSAILE